MRHLKDGRCCQEPSRILESISRGCRRAPHIDLFLPMHISLSKRLSEYRRGSTDNIDVDNPTMFHSVKEGRATDARIRGLVGQLVG